MNELSQFIRCPIHLIDEYDIATLNLRCAVGLPGAEDLDEGRMLDWLDRAAKKTKFETRRHWYRFSENPAAYNNLAGYFCCYFLLQTLQEDFGVKYNPARIRDTKFQDPKCFDPDFRDSRDLFIHGLIEGPGGTCSSMPVLYVAVGRRLGYPLKLVESRGHLFIRWDDPEGKCFLVPEVFNVEGTGSGIASYDDDHYRTWPEPWTEADIAGGWYLKSMTPREELASFLATRAHCLTDNGRLAEAVQGYGWASAVVPDDIRYSQIYAHTQQKYLAAQERELALVLETNQRNRERQERMLAGMPMAHAPWSAYAPIFPAPVSAVQPKLKYHDAMTRYHQELTEWTRQMRSGKASGMPPVAPRPGVDFDS